MEDNKTIEFWRPSGLLDKICSENKGILSEHLGDATDYIEEQGWTNLELHMQVVVAQIFFHMTEGEYAPSYPWSVMRANDAISDHYEDIAQDLYELKAYTVLGNRFFKEIDLEAELTELYVQSRVKEFLR